MAKKILTTDNLLGIFTQTKDYVDTQISGNNEKLPTVQDVADAKDILPFNGFYADSERKSGEIYFVCYNKKNRSFGGFFCGSTLPTSIQIPNGIELSKQGYNVGVMRTTHASDNRLFYYNGRLYRFNAAINDGGLEEIGCGGILDFDVIYEEGMAYKNGEIMYVSGLPNPMFVYIAESGHQHLEGRIWALGYNTYNSDSRITENYMPNRNMIYRKRGTSELYVIDNDFNLVRLAVRTEISSAQIVSRVSARDISNLLAKDKSVDVVPGVIVSFFNTETNAWEGWQFNCPPDLQEIERYDVMELWKKVW